MAYHEAGFSNCSNSFTEIIYTVVYMILAFSQCHQNQGCNLTLLKGVMHAIVACYHPASACMLHLVSTLFGTSIPASFNILLKYMLLDSQLCVHCIDTSIHAIMLLLHHFPYMFATITFYMSKLKPLPIFHLKLQF